jgi:hypothetical protein
MNIHVKDILKNNLGILIIGIAFLIFWFGGYGKNTGNQKPDTHDTVTTTTQVLQPMIINPPYTPQQQGNTVFPINIPAQYNASADIAKLTAQYEELVKNFLALKNYKDSITLKDTAGNRVGVVNLDQVVSENTLKSTQSSYQLYFPKTVTTITNTIYPKIKNQWFLGAQGSSTVGNPNINLGLGLLLKNKKENILQLGVGYNLTNKQPQVFLGYYQKIRLGKN